MKVVITTRGLPGTDGTEPYTFVFKGRKGYQLEIPCQPLGRSGLYRGDETQEAWLMGLTEAPSKARMIDVVASCLWRCRSEAARDQLMDLLRTREG